MPATVELRSHHGATPSAGTNVLSSTIRFKAADNDTVDSTDPLLIPLSGTVYSYVKQLRFYATTTPSNLINNLKFWTDGSNGYGTGITLQTKVFVGLTSTATSGTTTTLVNGAGPFTPSALIGYVLEMTSGSQSGQKRRITANTTTTLTVTPAFSSAIVNDDAYTIRYLDPIQNAQTSLAGATDAFSFTSSVPLSLAGSISNPTTGSFGDYMSLQLAITSAASQGNSGTESFTVSYDEA